MSFAALPLFPLNTVLFPGGALPLQIFEVRYLDLMKRCAQSGEPFGVVCLESGREVRRAPPSVDMADGAGGGEALASIGTLATLEHVSQPRAGLMLVQARGGERFALDSARQLPHGLWVGEARRLPADTAVAVPPELATLGPRLRHALNAVASRGQGENAAVPASDPRWQGDAGWLANRWAERLPLPPLERQRLMSLDNPVWRLELVAEWLERIERQSH